MEDLDIIEERDGMRVRLQRDESPEQPHDDGACPILTVETNRYGGYIVGAFNRQANDNDYVVDAAEILGRHGMETLERFFKIFRGATRMETYWSNGLEGNYVAFDTTAWLEEIGVTADNPDIEPVDRVSGSLEEVKAWAEGDVWGYIVEKKVTGRKVYDGEDINDAEPFEEWIEVEDGSCWGYYGRDYAETSAKEALETELEDN